MYKSWGTPKMYTTLTNIKFSYGLNNLRSVDNGFYGFKIQWSSHYLSPTFTVLKSTATLHSRE